MSLHDQVIQSVSWTEGWTSLERCLDLFDLIIEHRPRVVVEIGVYGGRTLIPQAMALREIGAGHIYGIDPWCVDAAIEGENEANRHWWGKVDLEEYHRKTMAQIWSLKLEPWCSVIRASSQYVADLFGNGTIDFLTVDGNHSEISSTRDVSMWLPKLRKGGVLHADDLDWPSLAKAKEMILAACQEVKGDGHFGIFIKK